MRPEHWLYTIPLRLRSLFRGAQGDQELDDELRDHLERKTEEYVARGMTQEDAHRRARLDLCGIEQTKEKCRDARRDLHRLQCLHWRWELEQTRRFSARSTPFCFSHCRTCILSNSCWSLNPFPRWAAGTIMALLPGNISIIAIATVLLRGPLLTKTTDSI